MKQTVELVLYTMVDKLTTSNTLNMTLNMAPCIKHPERRLSRWCGLWAVSLKVHRVRWSGNGDETNSASDVFNHSEHAHYVGGFATLFHPLC